MFILGSILVVALLAFGAWVGVMNWVFHFITLQNYRRGIGHHISPMPLIAQLCAGIAAVVAHGVGLDWVPVATFWCVALLDLSLWKLVFLPAFLLWHGIRRMLGRAT